MSHAIKNKKPLLTRVRRIKGQAEALEKALENEAECMAILQQIAAMRGAINGLMAEVLEDHIRLHLLKDGHEPITPDLGEELIDLVRAYLK